MSGKRTTFARKSKQQVVTPTQPCRRTQTTITNLDTKSLLNNWAKHPKLKALTTLLDDSTPKRIYISGLIGSSAALTFASITNVSMNKGAQRPTTLFVLNDMEEAGYFFHDLTQMIGESNVMLFPSSYRRAIKYNQKDAGNEIMRTEVLTRLARQPENLLIVSYPDAIAEKVVSKRQLNNSAINIKLGDRFDLDELQEQLTDNGFTATDYVYEPGQYASRGSILDIYSYTSDKPLRLDFFGDQLESIRTFDVQTQLSDSKIDTATILPEMNDKANSKVSLFHFLSDDALVVVKDLDYALGRIKDIGNEDYSSQAILEQEEELEDINRLVISDSEMREFVDSHKTVGLTHRQGQTGHHLEFAISPQPLFHKNFELLSQTLRDMQEKNYRLYILADSQKQHQRLKEILDSDTYNDRPDKARIAFTPVDKTLHEGFIDKDTQVCLFTDHQIFDRFHKYNLKSDKVRGSRSAITLKEISELAIGDYVVHINHGIGIFGGLVRLPLHGTTQEMIKISYQNNDSIYVPIHCLHQVSKYRGKDGVPPRLNILGSGAWERMKERVKNKVKDIARDLISLYAKRRKQKGFAFSPDTYIQHELEASFAYEDTPDQLRTTQEVKSDMEKPRPMDRLVCGDVGFGKTEIAIRAACKAACDGKQTAVLVPTTVLAYQHYKTFTTRLKEFPIKVDYLTRARNAKETKQILQDLEEGKTDIIIGTHKLVGKSVKFKDLGLLIIDEEQKFGVSVKEKLRQMRTNVDTLTLTATPIPRTLQFSLMGARDLSVIQTPPPNRYPIQTELHTFSPEIFTEAINFEMSRNGQVFVVNNRVSNLEDIANMIRQHVPDARVCIGHGQMDPKQLENIVLEFMNFDYDVMVSTTIIENGMDITNANTIIINNAQNYGLSDLHQMRGRVGRSNKKAFCYLIAPPLHLLPDDSRRRLQAICDFSELASGFNIAMQDLDIRGAGNMLGAEQSGFIADLGYETYQKVLNEAMQELKEDEFADIFEDEEETEDKLSTAGKKKTYVKEFAFVNETLFDSDMELLFPQIYVPNSRERMKIYKELDTIRDKAELDTFRWHLTDRFGKLPKEAEELMMVMPIRWAGRRLGVEKIVLRQEKMILHLVSNINSPYYQSAIFGKILHFAASNPRKVEVRNEGHCVVIVKSVRSVGECLAILEDMEASPSA